MLTKNDRVELEITGMTSEGCGVGRHGGLAVFVPNTVQGETVLAHIIKAKKNYAVGKCMDILKRSDKRTPSDCTVSERCGGCVFRHISYEEECRIKWERVRDAVRKIGGIDTEISPIVPSEEVNFYRNKAQYPVRMENGEVKIGFFAQRTHRIVSSDGCKLQRREFDSVLCCFEKWIKENGISVYDEVTGKGELRHIYIRRAHKTGQIMVCAVINAPNLTKKDALITLLTQNVEGLTSVVVNVNRKQTNVILGSEFQTIWGEDKIEDELCGVRLRISPHSFYQVNSPQAERLYKTAEGYADLKGGERVLDIYCGIGSVGLCAAKNAGELIGFEIVERAVQNARENAKLNGFKNTEFFCADASTAFQYLENRGKIDVVFLDPPRKGCDEKLIDDVAKANPEKIVYISCDPATLARDLKRFSEKGYKTEKITPVDMFPRTHHVESVVLLARFQQ